MKRTLEVLNELEQQGVFTRYAIGGAMGAIFYTERSMRSMELCASVVTMKKEKRSRLKACRFSFSQRIMR